MIASVHPLVGTWKVRFPDEPGDGFNLNAYTADGIVLQASAARPGQGVWEPTGERSAAMTLVILLGDSVVMVRGDIAVDAGGVRFTGSFTTERLADGLGEKGPLGVVGERVTVEAAAGARTGAPVR
jgi:hypothetical protein